MKKNLIVFLIIVGVSLTLVGCRANMAEGVYRRDTNTTNTTNQREYARNNTYNNTDVNGYRRFTEEDLARYTKVELDVNSINQNKNGLGYMVTGYDTAGAIYDVTFNDQSYYDFDLATLKSGEKVIVYVDKYSNGSPRTADVIYAQLFNNKNNPTY